MDVAGIYGLYNTLTGKWYVGQSVGIFNRWNIAYKGLRCKSQVKIYRALLKYGYEAFEKVVLETCDDVDWILDYREMYWMRHLDSVKNGYNLKSGGSRGKHSDESRRKLSDSLRAHYKSHPPKPMSAEHRKKISDAVRGKPRKGWSKERRDKMLEKQRNWPF
jgi:group I intron endonuclease